MLLYNNIPAELRAEKRWLCWQYEKREGKEKLDKVPYMAVLNKSDGTKYRASQKKRIGEAMMLLLCWLNKVFLMVLVLCSQAAYTVVLILTIVLVMMVAYQIWQGTCLICCQKPILKNL